jgi:hypothetical protein
MKVPKGKTVYQAGKKYRAGDDVPDEVAETVDLGKAPAKGGRKRPAAGAGEASKPSDR